jgi:peptidyl-prolyl cis-trans isomerase SurA
MRTAFIAFLLVCTIYSYGQTVFSYGPYTVNKKEFWRAYTKNNTGGITEASIREYLDLFIRFKLKVQAAKDSKLDTLPTIKSDVAGFRAQLVDQFMRKQTSSRELVEEAAKRSTEELEIAHVFVGYGKDSTSAKTQIEKAYKELLNGADFKKTVINYSTNEQVKNKAGYIGYISAFSLPYTLENVVYNLNTGGLSKPVAGANGWHIFKLLNKRSTAGLLKAAQILLALPQEASTVEIETTKKLADSVYTLLQNGFSFSEAAVLFSTDKFSFSSGGVLPEFTYTTYDPAFSSVAFGLKNDNDISKPFRTSLGWHIVKRISLSPFNIDLNDAQVFEEWNAKVSADSRTLVAIESGKERLKKLSGYKALPFNEQQLWKLTDTMLKSKNYAEFFKANRTKMLFQLKAKNISISDWLQYAKSQQRNLKASQNNYNYSNLFKQFVNETVEQYYKDRLEQMDDEFNFQVKEFTEGSLLFEIMEQNIWSKAPADSVGLINYFKANQSKYKWMPSVNAIIFNCSDTAVAHEALKMMQQYPEKWKEIMDNMGGRALADSGRYEYAQLPVKPGTDLVPGLFTPIDINSNDGSASFCYILKRYTGEEPRLFDEAKGLVINDYQLLLEEKWIQQLKKKYPVKVNEETVKGLK